ncbi:MAG: glycosyltransferase [Pseudomonadota bacterium]
MRVLHVTPSFYPATRLGGPIQSTLGLCNALASKAGVDLTVLTTNMGSQSTEKRLSDETLRVHSSSNYSVTYSKCWWGKDVAPGLLGSLWRAVNTADIVHLTGVYSFPTVPTLLLARMAVKPVLWSPRGALLAASDWKSVNRPRLKFVWETACRIALNYDSTVVHATSQAELAASLTRMPCLRGVVIPNGVVIPKAVSRPKIRVARPGDSELRLMFIGRLDPIKALDNLISSLSQLPYGFAKLRIFGSGQCAYEKHLKKLVAAAGLEKQVEFEGHVDGHRKTQAFAEADVCVVPSHIESFGMVVGEALAHGLPVIVSKGVPWPDIEAWNCGISTENSPRKLADAILEMSRRDCQAMGLNGRRWVLEEFDWSNVCDRFLKVYGAMIHGKECTNALFQRMGERQ